MRVTWESVFPRGRGCEEVEFLIKSHPLHSPSDYKLSDLTLKGKRTAVLAVPAGEDFIFQVIARENKGPGIGIEYAYSRPATSVHNPSPDQVSSLRQSIWVAGDTGSGNLRQAQARPPPPPSPSPPPPPPSTTQRTYLRPSVRSLGPPYSSRLGSGFQQPQDELEEIQQGGAGGGAGPWFVYECIPLLKNLAGFEQGSKRNSILTEFIKHMNKNAVASVSSFLGEKKGCQTGYEGKERGHLVQSEVGDSKCCSTPWAGAAANTVCYDQFAR